jgi:serine/threonine-protein kinase
LQDRVARHRRFVIDDCLGRGGFGEVYRARMHLPSGLSRIVALKLLRADAPDSRALARLRDEARLLAALKHPNILRVDDLISLHGHPAVVAEYVDGLDWSRLLHDAPVWVHAEIASHVADALEAAWTAVGADGPLHLVHRDIKPSNVRISWHGEVKLLDFGVALFASLTREARTSSDEIVGSLAYLAPERFRTNESTGAADVFSLCCALFLAVSGKPFHTRPSARVVAQLASDPVLWEHAVADRLRLIDNADLADLLGRGLRWDPTQRPEARIVSHELGALARVLAPDQRLRDWVRTRPRPADAAMSGRWTGQTIEETVTATTTLPAAPSLRIESGRSRQVGRAGFGCAAAIVAVGCLVLVPLIWAWLG